MTGTDPKLLSTAQMKGRLDEAALWRVRIEEDDAVERSPEFVAWFADPLNQQAFSQACVSWEVFDYHLSAPELLAVRRDALTNVHDATVTRFSRRPRRLMTIAATLLVVALAGLGTWQFLSSPAVYRTGIGERRILTLDDGSRVSLDSDSAVRVRYTKDVRQLVLEQGRARFDVTHDVNRPFSVTAGKETVVAVGTSFNVEKLGSTVLVTLIEGHVIVKSADDATVALPVPHARPLPPRQLALAAGQELEAPVSAKAVVAATDLKVATAWEHGVLILNNEPLGEAVERVNRYTNRPISVDGPIAGLRISGVFNAGDVSSFLDAVTSYFAVQATTTSDNQILLQKRT